MNPIDKVEACDQCESCLSFNRSASFNIHELDAASNNSVEDIRNLVDQVRIPPQVGKYKVYIIDEVHMLSTSAFNAFLKTLEEPPSYAKFILATTEKHKIIPTILSRCQIFDFKRIVVKDIADYLGFVAKKEGVTAEEEALHVIAQKADGAMRDALSFFDQLVSFSGNSLSYESVTEHLNILDHSYYFRIMDQVLLRDTAGILLTINEIINRGFDGQHFLIGLGEHLRNLLVGQDPKTIMLLEISLNLQQKYVEQAKKCAPSFLLKALDIHNQFDQSYKTSNNKRLQLELAMLQICTASVGAFPATNEKKNSLIPPEGVVEESSVVSRQSLVGSQKSAVSSQKPEVRSQQSEARSQKPEVSSSVSVGRTISIKPENHVPKDAVQGQGNEVLNAPKQEFSQEKLEKVWLYYTESIAGQYPNYYSILSTRKPAIKEGHNLELKLDNRGQEIAFKERKADLMDFLRAELINQEIQLEVIIQETSDQAKHYTPEEKLRYMEEKYPALKALKEGLELEIEY